MLDSIHQLNSIEFLWSSFMSNTVQVLQNIFNSEALKNKLKNLVKEKGHLPYLYSSIYWELSDHYQKEITPTLEQSIKDEKLSVKDLLKAYQEAANALIDSLIQDNAGIECIIAVIQFQRDLLVANQVEVSAIRGIFNNISASTAEMGSVSSTQGSAQQFQAPVAAKELPSLFQYLESHPEYRGGGGVGSISTEVSSSLDDKLKTGYQKQYGIKYSRIFTNYAKQKNENKKEEASVINADAWYTLLTLAFQDEKWAAATNDLNIIESSIVKSWSKEKILALFKGREAFRFSTVLDWILTQNPELDLNKGDVLQLFKSAPSCYSEILNSKNRKISELVNSLDINELIAALPDEPEQAFSHYGVGEHVPYFDALESLTTGQPSKLEQNKESLSADSVSLILKGLRFYSVVYLKKEELISRKSEGLYNKITSFLPKLTTDHIVDIFLKKPEVALRLINEPAIKSKLKDLNSAQLKTLLQKTQPEVINGTLYAVISEALNKLPSHEKQSLLAVIVVRSKSTDFKKQVIIASDFSQENLADIFKNSSPENMNALFDTLFLKYRDMCLGYAVSGDNFMRLKMYKEKQYFPLVDTLLGSNKIDHLISMLSFENLATIIYESYKLEDDFFADKKERPAAQHAKKQLQFALAAFNLDKPGKIIPSAENPGPNAGRGVEETVNPDEVRKDIGKALLFLINNAFNEEYRNKNNNQQLFDFIFKNKGFANYITVEHLTGLLSIDKKNTRLEKFKIKLLDMGLVEELFKDKPGEIFRLLTDSNINKNLPKAVKDTLIQLWLKSKDRPSHKNESADNFKPNHHKAFEILTNPEIRKELPPELKSVLEEICFGGSFSNKLTVFFESQQVATQQQYKQSFASLRGNDSQAVSSNLENAPQTSPSEQKNKKFISSTETRNLERKVSTTPINIPYKHKRPGATAHQTNKALRLAARSGATQFYRGLYTFPIKAYQFLNYPHQKYREEKTKLMDWIQSAGGQFYMVSLLSHFDDLIKEKELTQEELLAFLSVQTIKSSLEANIILAALAEKPNQFNAVSELLVGQLLWIVSDNILKEKPKTTENVDLTQRQGREKASAKEIFEKVDQYIKQAFDYDPIMQQKARSAVLINAFNTSRKSTTKESLSAFYDFIKANPTYLEDIFICAQQWQKGDMGTTFSQKNLLQLMKDETLMANLTAQGVIRIFVENKNNLDEKVAEKLLNRLTKEDIIKIFFDWAKTESEPPPVSGLLVRRINFDTLPKVMFDEYQARTGNNQENSANQLLNESTRLIYRAQYERQKQDSTQLLNKATRLIYMAQYERQQRDSIAARIVKAPLALFSILYSFIYYPSILLLGGLPLVGLFFPQIRPINIYRSAYWSAKNVVNNPKVYATPLDEVQQESIRSFMKETPEEQGNPLDDQAKESMEQPVLEEREESFQKKEKVPKKSSQKEEKVPTTGHSRVLGKHGELKKVYTEVEISKNVNGEIQSSSIRAMLAPLSQTQRMQEKQEAFDETKKLSQSTGKVKEAKNPNIKDLPARKKTKLHDFLGKSHKRSETKARKLGLDLSQQSPGAGQAPNTSKK